MPKLSLNGDPVVPKKTAVVIKPPAKVVKPEVDSADWASSILDKYEYYSKADGTRVKAKINSAKGVPGELGRAVAHISPHAKSYKIMLDSGLAEEQKLNPEKTTLTLQEMDKYTGGKGAEANRYIDLYERYRGMTVNPEEQAPVVTAGSPRFGGNSASKKLKLYSPGSQAASLAPGAKLKIK